MSYLFDLALLAIIAVAVLIAKKKGFVKASYTIVSMIVSIILILILQAPFTSYLKGSALGKNIESKVHTQVENTAGDSVGEIADKMGLPSFVADAIPQDTKDQAIDAVTDTITEAVIKVLAFIILFILIRIAVHFILNSINCLMKLPVLSTINKWLAIPIGLINGVLAVYIICALIILLSPSEAMSNIGNIANESFIFKFFYNNNLLLSSFI